MKYLIVVVSALVTSGIILNVEGLKCFDCYVSVTSAGVNGDPSCLMGNTPNDTWLEDCPPMQDGVCTTIFRNQTAPNPFTSTLRLCGAKESTTLECSTRHLDPPYEGYETRCFCDTDRCDPDDSVDTSTPTATEKSSSVSNMIPFQSTVTLTVTIAVLSQFNV